MATQIPVTGDAVPNEPPPPYHVAAGYDKNPVYPSAPSDWSRPPDPATSTVSFNQSGGYPPPQPEYACPPGFPQPGYVPLPQGRANQHPPPAYGPTYTWQPGYAGNPPQATVIVQQPLLSSHVPSFQERPVQTVCPKCHESIVTMTYYENGTLNWLLCAVICLIGCDAGCCLIPFCIDSCKDVIHICPNCQQTISRFNRL